MKRLFFIVLMAVILAPVPAGAAGAEEGQAVSGMLVEGTGYTSVGIPVPGTKADGTEGSGDGNLTLATAEDAIERARELFPQLIRDKEKELRVDYREDHFEGRKYWSLRWNGEVLEGMRNYFEIRFDAGDAKLLRFSRQMKNESELKKGRVITRDEAKQVALSFIRQHHPEKLAKMVLDTDYRVQGSGNDLNLVYSFRWYHEIDGIPLNDNSIFVQVDALTGQVTSYNCRWQEVPGVQEVKAMDVNQLAKLLTDKLGLYPEYVVEYGVSSSTLPGAKPVYRLNTKYHRFSAKSGKPVDNLGNEVDWNEAKLFNEEFNPVSGREQKGMEQQDGQSFNQIQAQSKAEEFFKKLGFEGRAQRSGGGSASWPGYTEKYYNYRLVTGDDREFPGDSQIDVSINTATGEVQRYYNHTGEAPGDNSEDGISLEEALSIAKEFLKMTNSGNLKEMVLRQDSRGNYPQGAPPHYNFTWVGLVNGVPYTGDIVRVTVSRYSGEVREFYRQSRPVKSFASIKGILSREEAAEALLKAAPFKLSYDRIRDPEKGTEKTILVYHTDYGQGIDAHTGEKKQIGTDKEEAESYGGKLHNHWAGLPLMLLADSGLLPAPEEFDPNAAVNRRDGLKVMSVAGTSYYRPSHPLESPFEDVTDDDPDIVSIIRAVDNGIVEEGGKLHPGSPLTREDLAVWLVNALGHKEVAGAPISMTVDFKDAARISDGKKNYVAIAAGLGLMAGDGDGNFRPGEPVTWGELATVVIKAAPKLR